MLLLSIILIAVFGAKGADALKCALESANTLNNRRMSEGRFSG
jgi:hypothetical protein